MKTTLIAAIAALAIPASALAADETTTTPSARDAAMTACKTQRAAIGKAAFKLLYGANGYGKCVNATVKTEKANIAEAKSDCKAEQAMTDEQFAASAEDRADKTFTTYYGTNKTGKNAYGKCVSGKAKAASKEDTKTKINAAKTCKQMRKDNPEDFTAKNSFGKCVSKVA